MNTTKKEKEALEKIRNVYETLLGIDRNEITPDKFLSEAPKNLKTTDPSYDKYLGMDEVDAIISMLYIEQEFNKDVDDTGFVPLPDEKNLWITRPIKDLVDFCVDTLMD